MSYRLKGLLAATYTPMNVDRTLDLAKVGPMVDRLVAEDLDGLYVCGSTGEGMSLTGAERRVVSESFVSAAAGRVPVIVQVGHNSIVEAVELADHAQRIGANAVSATSPSYYPINSVEMLVDCMAEVAAAAANVPFYYYHIPTLTGTSIDMVTFLEQASKRIPNLVGIKYTCTTVHEYQACCEFQDGRFDILWGCDEMLLSAIAIGAEGAIGSTYNIAAPLYRAIFNAVAADDLVLARQLQSNAVAMIRTIYQYPFHPAMKRVLGMLDRAIDCGPCRLPLGTISDDQTAKLRESLDQLGFFEWIEGCP